MNRSFSFEQVDVFTQERFRGNPLAVLTDARGLTKKQMQDIAREMNLSETTFVVPAERSDCAARVYILTPTLELPFAGHPTIGTAWVLATRGLLPRGTRTVQLLEEVGPVAVRLEGDLENPTSLWLTAPPVNFGRVFEQRAEIAAALNLTIDDLHPTAPVQLVPAPNRFIYIALQNTRAVDRVVLNKPAIMPIIGSEDPAGVFFFAQGSKPNRVYSRMLGVDSVGVDEDPATGSASGALGAYLLRYGLAEGSKDVSIVSEQGTKMGRQSFVHILVERDGNEFRRIEVGGSVVPALTGSLEMPLNAQSVAT